MILYIVLAVYTLYFLNEVYHDNYFKKVNILAAKQDPIALARYSSKWHSADWRGHALIAVLTGFLASTGSEVVQWYWIVLLYTVMIGCLRVLILNIGLNLLEPKVKWYYLGSGKIDNFFRKVPIIYYLACAITLATTIFLLIKL